MTKDEALAYCYKHRDEFLADAYADGEDGLRLFDCLISCLKDGYIKPDGIADCGMAYDTPAAKAEGK